MKIKPLYNQNKKIAAIISTVLMLACVFGLYVHEFNISDKPSDLELSINQKIEDYEISAEVLQTEVLGNKLYVLFGERSYPKACGLACFEKGIFGNYRFVSCEYSNLSWINGERVTYNNKNYYISYCANILNSIDEYGLFARGMYASDAQSDYNKPVFKQNYTESSFINITEIETGTSYLEFRMKYFKDGNEIPEKELESILGASHVENAPLCSVYAAELWLFYVYEVIIILIGLIFIKFFLTSKK